MNAITCMSWVKRGVCAGKPSRVGLSEDDIKKLISEPQDAGGSDSEDALSAADSDTSDIDKKYKLDGYDRDSDDPGSEDNDEDEEDDDDDDDEDTEDDNSESDVASPPPKSRGKRGGLTMSGLTSFASNKSDPYIAGDVADSSDEEAEIHADDNLLTVGKVNREYSGLEVYVYNEGSGSLYCHHDTILGAFPLAIEWVGFDPGEEGEGNLLAIGSMEPDIELWDIDVVNNLEPAFVLKGAKKKKGKKKQKVTGHTDAVLDLSWNHRQTQVLASASADFSIGLWDLTNGDMVTSIRHHEEKVQAIKWHPFEHQTLLSGSFDKTVKVYDCRTSDATHKSWTLSGEVERVAWNHHAPYYFLASDDAGRLVCLDVRTDAEVWAVDAHKSAVTGLAVSADLPGCVLTSSGDKLVKVWDVRESSPELVHTQNYHVGQVHCLVPCPDSGAVFGVGGETELRIVHLGTVDGLVERFGGTVAGGGTTRSTASSDEDYDTTSSDDDTASSDEDEVPKKVKKNKKTAENGPNSTRLSKQEATSSEDEERIVQKVTKEKKKKKKKTSQLSAEAASETSVKSSKKLKNKKAKQADTSAQDRDSVQVKQKVKKVKKVKPELSDTNVDKSGSQFVTDSAGVSKKKKSKKKKKVE